MQCSIFESKPPRAAAFALRKNEKQFEGVSDYTNERRACESGAYPEKMSCIPSSLLRGKSGLSRVDLALLAYVMENPEQGSRADIAEDCECAANSIPRSAKKLEQLGLLERVPGGGSKHTTYRLGRNMHVTTTRNTEVSRNNEVTTPETSKLRAASCVNETETTTRDMVVTQVTTPRNNPPLEPPNNTNSTVEDNHQPPEPSFEGGLGELFDDKPARKTKRRVKRVATDETMPRQPTANMIAHAAKNDFFNGTVAAMFDAWRDWHIAAGSQIADYEASWRTWVGKRVEWRAKDAAKGAMPKGYKLAGVGADGKPRYVKDQRANVYR
jgi:predicted transcriptional regulator